MGRHDKEKKVSVSKQHDSGVMANDIQSGMLPFTITPVL